MILRKDSNLINNGDLIDLYLAFRRKGVALSFSSLFFGKNRTRAKWENFESSVSDFWVIPAVQRWWNMKCTGSENCEYEDYLCRKYLAGKSGLRLLSVGCGNSGHETTFFRSGCFASVLGIDLSDRQLDLSREDARKQGCDGVIFRQGDFEMEKSETDFYDVVLFHSSLHHFKNVKEILQTKVKPALKHDGLLIIFEYTGPDRLQWTDQQLTGIKLLLNTLPIERRVLYLSGLIKKKVYRPGLIRMFISDPSEAADSETILSAVHSNFDILEETKLGGNLLHPLLKGISHHFADESTETLKILRRLFKADDEFVKDKSSDFTFGVYRKK